jgi:hypothetical protein
MSWHTSLGDVRIEERIWRTAHSDYLRLFCKAARITQRGCSRRLQRLACDFGLEHSFEKATARLLEHHAVRLSQSTARALTLKHAARLCEAQLQREKVRVLPARGAERIITEADGSMLPIVECGNTSEGTDNAQADRRKQRKITWQEARLAAAQQQGSARVHYAVSFGDVHETGEQWARATREAGWAANTHIHALGDGAEWIEAQHRVHFARHGSYLVDFFHVCEYLGEAAPPGEAGWMETQKERLKTNRHDQVLAELARRIESETTPDENAPVRAAHRYLSNRTQVMDYQAALEQGLPIGSGMIESGHRHIFQSRLKIPGAAWLRSTAQSIAHARAARANQLWDSYWGQN